MFRKLPGLFLVFAISGCGGGGGGAGGGAGGASREPDGPPAGLFLTSTDIERIDRQVESGVEPYAGNYEKLVSRADAALSEEADPFEVDNVRAVRFGWCESPDATDDTLRELTVKLEKQTDRMRTLALAWVLSGDEKYAEHAVDMLMSWALDGDVVNLHDFNVDFAAADFDGMSDDGYCGTRPWNFALDAMWQTYGLINASDAYLLLTRNGYRLSEQEDATIRDWILDLAEAVNSSFQSWTRWADANPDDGSYERYRSDNHLSWSLAGLVAAAVALEDDALARYALDGATWTDGRGGSYANPSSIRSVIEHAIEAGPEPDTRGRIFEEKILRDPPIGYATYHLWAMALVARQAELHFGDDVWAFRGKNGAGLQLAFDRYAEFALGERESPEPDQETNKSSRPWLWEFAYRRWPETRYRGVVESDSRDIHLAQSVGPLALVASALGPDPRTEPAAPAPGAPGASPPPSNLPDAPVFQARSLSQFGITWTFDGAYTAGRFANGDFWVVGPVRVVGINPPSKNSGGRTRNGSMLNPSPRLGTRQGYDSSMDKVSWDPSLNVASGVSSSKPLALRPGFSLVSTISVDKAGHRPQLKTAAVLTVLDSVPPQGAFRPPYAGTDKRVRFTTSRLNYGLLQRLPRVPNTPDLAAVERYFERPWIDHIPDFTGRYHHPAHNMPDYGRELSTQVGEGALMLHLDFTNAQKERLLVRYVQLGIDLFGIVRDGGEENWVPNGGHTSGRKWPILFAGLMLNDPAMRDIGKDKSVFFGEDAQTFYVLETSPGVYNFGHGGYGRSDAGLPEYGIRHATAPHRDDKSWGSDYRQCCTANAWTGFVLAAHIMGVKRLWNHDALFDYLDRYVAIEKGDFRSWSDFAEAMWDRYRSGYGRVWKR